jgi:hypothetical protein
MAIPAIIARIKLPFLPYGLAHHPAILRFHCCPVNLAWLVCNLLHAHRYTNPPDPQDMTMVTA